MGTSVPNPWPKQQPKELMGYNGLWSRGNYSACPPEYLTDCYNCSFPGRNQVDIRQPFLANVATAATPAWHFIARLTSGDVLLTLSTDGKLRDETNVVILKTWTFANVNGFAAINIYGRCYLSPTKNGQAVSGEKVYYYDGTNFSVAAGIKPATTATLTQPSSGNVDVGVHTAAVVFQYTYGYLSPPSSLATITSDGSHNIHFASIPTGGAGVVARVLLLTVAGGSQLFFIPGGTINDNTTTTFDYNGYDTSLISDASYLYNILTAIPACSSMLFYKGRMIFIGQTGAPDQELTSDLLILESVNSVNNLINLPVDDASNGTNTGMIIRDVLYFTKPAGTYATQDNGGNPSTWPVTIIDSGLGAYNCGLSTFASSGSAQDIMDSALCINKRGLMLFTGNFQDPPLTYNIESIWQMIDSRFIYNAQIAHDVNSKVVYLAVPLMPATSIGNSIGSQISATNSLILAMDYKDGLSATTVKWTVWTNGLFPVSSMLMENFSLTGYGSNFNIYQLSFCNAVDGYIYSLAPIVSIISGVVNTSGVNVTQVSGNTFQPALAGTQININGVYYPLSVVIDSKHLTLRTPAGTQSGVSYYMNVTSKYAQGDYSPTVITQAINQYVITAVVSFGVGVNVFTTLDMDLVGFGPVSIYLLDKNRTALVSVKGFNLTNYPNVNVQRLINFVGEGMQIAFQSNALIPAGG